MFRKMIPLAVALVLVIGCKKKAEDGGGGGGGGGDGKIDSDPNAAFTIKLRDEQAGDKTEQTVTETATVMYSLDGKSEKVREDTKLVYTETIIDFPAGAGSPAKFTHTYTMAMKYDQAAGGMKSLPFEGKTVTIEPAARSQFTVDGIRLKGNDALDLSREYSLKGASKKDDLLPKKAVKVGETWDLDAGVLKVLGRDMSFSLNMTKSKLTGKLTRAYIKDGKQWGVIALDLDLVLNTVAAGGVGKSMARGSSAGTVKVTGLLDAVIDGSVRDGTMTMTVKMDVTRDEDGGEMKITTDTVRTQTIKTVK